MNTVLAVQVTDEDIDHGIRGDCEHCALARAIRRAFVNRGYRIDNVRSYDSVYLYEYNVTKVTHLMPLNDEMREYAINFDSWKRGDEGHHIRPEPKEFILFLE